MFVLLIALLVQVPENALAQASGVSRASNLLYLDHWAYSYIDFLQERGHLNGLYRMVRPYSRMDVAANLNAIEPETLNAVETHLFSVLRNEFADELVHLSEEETSPDAVALTTGLEIGPGVTGLGNDLGADVNLNVKAGLATRYFSAFQRMRIDDRLAEDPLYFGRRQGGFGARMEDAYGLVRFSPLTFFIGRTARAWGPASSGGSLVSSNPYSYDHVGFQLDTRHIAFSSLFARLDDTAFGNEIQKRFFAAHRLDVRLSDRYQFGLTESSIYGGADAGFDPAVVNPFGFLHEVQLNSGKEANTFFTLDWWMRPLENVVFFGEFLLDDFVLDGSGEPPPNRDTSPDRLGWVVGLKLQDVLFENGTLDIGYRRVGSYTYNVKSKRPWQGYLYEQKGLGAFTNDFDLSTVSYDYFLMPSFRIGSAITLLRKGSRDLGSNDFEDSTFVKLDFPSGTVEKKWSGRLWAMYQPDSRFNLQAFVQVDLLRNRNHSAGNSDKELLAGIELYLSTMLVNWLLD